MEEIALRRFFLAVFCALALSLSALAADAALPSLEAAVNVREDGVCEGTMTSEVDFSAAQDSLLIPLGTDARDITLAGWSYETVLQDGVTCLKLSNPAGFSGKQQFTCSYTLPCRAAEAADGQQFRLSLPETGWDYAIDSYTLTMTFPAEVTNAPEWTSGYYGDVVDNYLDIRTQENTVTAKSTAAMRDHETLTVAVQFPADTFNLRDQPGKTAGFDRIAFLVLLAAAVAFWFLRLRSGLILPRAQQTIGMESTAGEIPCQLLGEAPDAAGMIVHWGNLGYLTVRMSRGRVILYKRMEMGNERKPSERRFFAALFRAGASCEAGGLRYQAAVREMHEETGLTFHPLKVDPCYEKPFFTTIGLTDEACSAVYGWCEGEISRKYLEESEVIEVVLADREEAKRILKEENVAIMCSYHLMHFIHDEEPFAFLK